MSEGFDQVVPLKESVFPPLSTATQNVVPTLDSEVMALLPRAAPATEGSTGSSPDHEKPLQARMFPTESAATQKPALAQETASSRPEVSTSWGVDQTCP